MRLRGSLEIGAVGLAAAVLAVACGHDWDALDPRLGAASASGAGGANSGPVGASVTSTGSPAGSGGMSTSQSSGSITSTGTSSNGGATTSTSTTSTTSTTTTGSGGGVPAHCGGTGVLAYDFTDPNDPGDLFDTNVDSNAGTVTQVGGAGVIKLPSALQQGWYGSFETFRVYDLHADHLFVKVPQVPNQATTAIAFLSLNIGQDSIGFYEQSGMIHFVGTVGGNDFELAKVAYDPAQHLYWSLREDGMGTVFWETSSDGVNFVVRAQKATAQLSPINALDVELGAFTNGGEVNPGSASFDDVNGGGPASEKWCPSSSFSDDFNDGVQAPQWGLSYADPVVTMTEAGGVLNFDLQSNETGFGNYSSNVSFDMTGDAVLVQVVAGPNVATTAQVYLRASHDDQNYLDIAYEKGKVYFEDTLDGSQNDLGSTLVSAGTAWIRIRESGGTTYWETSADGKTWTSNAQTPNVIDMTRVDISIGAGTYEDVVNPGTVKVDNYNLPP